MNDYLIILYLSTHKLLGAPECFDSDVPVSQKIDIWSLGCVLSTAATWVVSGFSGIRNFEHRLKIAVLDTGIGNDRVMLRFHDGKNVLPEVTKWHKALRRSIRTNDHITGRVLDLIDEHLLQGDPKLRFDSKELCKYLDRLLQQEAKTPQLYTSPLVELAPLNFSIDSRIGSEEDFILGLVSLSFDRV